MAMRIAVLPGDGIGKEVTAQAVKVLKAVVGAEAEFTEGLIGAAALKAAGVPLAPETFELAKRSAAILSGAMLLRHSFGRKVDAARIEQAVRSVLAKGLRTQDILQPGTVKVGTAAMGDAVVAALT